MVNSIRLGEYRKLAATWVSFIMVNRYEVYTVFLTLTNLVVDILAKVKLINETLYSGRINSLI